MKRLIAATLALSLLGTAAASARSFGHHGGFGGGYHGGGWHGRNDGALIGLGVGLFALGALAAASSSHDRYYDQYDYGPPPPPPPPVYDRYGPQPYQGGYDDYR
jgi:opacity protein-like surface antigen